MLEVNNNAIRTLSLETRVQKNNYADEIALGVDHVLEVGVHKQTNVQEFKRE